MKTMYLLACRDLFGVLPSKTFILLHDSSIKKDLTTNEIRKPSGEAFVSLETEDDVQRAMPHNKVSSEQI